MSRYICVDGIETLIELEDAPSIDIVFCKDCKYTDGNPPIADGRSWCVLHGSFMYYCSDGCRKEGSV